MGRLRNSAEVTAAIDSIVEGQRQGRTPDSRARKTMMKLHTAMDSNGFQANHFRDLILPLTQPSSFYLLNLIEDALMHPNCPPDVLKKVCMSNDTISSRCRKAAMANPNCPEEAGVYAALSSGKEQGRSHDMSMRKGTNSGGPR